MHSDATMTAEGVVIVDPERYKWRALIGCILGFAFDGVDFLVLALAMPYLIKDWGITMAQGGAIGSATLLGACFAGYIWGPIADKWGRKKTIMTCLTFFGLATALSGFSQNYIQLSIIRFVAGLGLGGEWALGGTIVSEFFPPNQRSKASSYTMWGWPIGYAIALAFQALLVPIYGWRALFFAGISSVFAALYIWIFVPESPAWLKARENKRLGIQSQSQTIATAVRWRDLFKGTNLYYTILCTLLCGSCLTAYWGQGTWIPTFLAKERGLNLRGMTEFILGAQIAAAIGYPIFGWIGDKLGRRWSIGLGSFMTGVFLVLWLTQKDYTWFFWVGMVGNVIGSYWGPLAAFCAEQFPTQLRAFAVSFCYSSGRFIAVFFPLLLGAVAQKSSLAFAMGTLVVVYIIGAVVVFLMRETKTVQIVD